MTIAPPALLLITIFLPLAGVGLVWLLSPLGAKAVRWCALLATLVTFALSCVLAAGFPVDGDGVFAVTDVPWLTDAGVDIRFSVGLDGLSLWLFCLSALLMIPAVLVSWTAVKDRAPLFYALLLLLECGCLGVFTARDIILFYAFFEFTLIPLFFLIGIWGSEQRRYAAVKFFLFTFAGSVLTFLGLLAMVLWSSGRLGVAGEWNRQGAAALNFAIPTQREDRLARYAESVAALDQTQDGRLSADELASGELSNEDRAARQRQFKEILFRKLDKNADGFLAREEGTAGLYAEDLAAAEEIFQDQNELSPAAWQSADIGEIDNVHDWRLRPADLRHADFTLEMILFLALFAGFAIKVPLFPLHTWLPLAHTEAPTAGSVILAGVLLKIGTYGFLRFSLPLLPAAAVACAPWILALSVVGIIYGALVALAQKDIKRLIAYSSVSHLGFCMLGIFAFTALGTQGGALQMINHGISTGALFALVGMLYERYHTRRIADFGGLAKKTPWIAFFMVLFTLSSIGLPGLNGFAGEFLLLLGMFQKAFISPPPEYALAYRVMAVAAVSGVVLGAWYMLLLVRRVFFGPLKEPHLEGNHAPVRDMTPREGLALVPLAVLVFWIGLWPQFFLDRMGPALNDARAAVTAIERGRGSEMEISTAGSIPPAQVDLSPAAALGPSSSGEERAR